MPFRRLLVVLDASLDAEPVLRAAARVAPRASHVEVCALIEDDHAAASRAGLGLGNLERVREVLRDGAGDGPPAEPTAPLTVVLGTAFDRDRLADAARRARAELVVVGPWAAHSARERVLSVLELASSAGVHVLSVGAFDGNPWVSNDEGDRALRMERARGHLDTSGDEGVLTVSAPAGPSVRFAVTRNGFRNANACI